MNDISGSVHRSIANPRRITLATPTEADPAAHRAATPPHGAAGDDHGLQILADDGAVCVDGRCALPE